MDYTQENPAGSSIDTSYLSIKEAILNSDFSDIEKETLQQLIRDNKKNIEEGSVVSFTWPLIKELVDKYKKSELFHGDTVINVEMGFYGSIAIRNVKTAKQPGLQLIKYESGNYDYVGAELEAEQVILFTDDSDVEPFNRQGPFYVPYSFKNLTPMDNNGLDKKYRVFSYFQSGSNLNWAIPGFKYNEVWKIVTFGICLDRDKAEEFVRRLLILIGKPNIS
jgi:hypothetical protein